MCQEDLFVTCMAPASWIGTTMTTPWYLWLVFPGIIGQEPDDLVISDMENETKMN